MHFTELCISIHPLTFFTLYLTTLQNIEDEDAKNGGLELTYSAEELGAHLPCAPCFTLHVHCFGSRHPLTRDGGRATWRQQLIG